MRKAIALTGMALLAAALASPSMAGSDDAAQAVRGLDTFKALAGNWQGTNSKGDSVKVTYEVVSNGSAVMERLQMGDHHDMVTLYHLNGERLMLTHYCAAGNQPRMVAESVSDAQIKFRFLDATALASAEDGHMHGAVFNFAETGLKAEWTWREKGKDAFTEVIKVRRAE